MLDITITTSITAFFSIDDARHTRTLRYSIFSFSLSKYKNFIANCFSTYYCFTSDCSFPVAFFKRQATIHIQFILKCSSHSSNLSDSHVFNSALIIALNRFWSRRKQKMYEFQRILLTVCLFWIYVFFRYCVCYFNFL